MRARWIAALFLILVSVIVLNGPEKVASASQCGLTFGNIVDCFKAMREGREAYDRGDYAEALRLWLPYAEQGDPWYQRMIGRMYALGQGVPQDYVLSYMWLNLASAAAVGEERDNATLER